MLSRILSLIILTNDQQLIDSSIIVIRFQLASMYMHLTVYSASSAYNSLTIIGLCVLLVSHSNGAAISSLLLSA